ncbi:MAG: hypothetical protein KDA87_05050, partial [Planctomycetales bacterium]|nr:hypothetical protein [Planctomycetales bacterium]
MQIKLISTFLLFGFASAVLWADDSSGVKKESELAYPETRKVDQVDDYFGTKVPDPYRWLEQDVRESDEVRQWTETQNAVTREMLDSIAARQQIIDKLTKLWNYPKYSAPSKKANKYFFSKNDGLQNQSVLYVSESYDGEAKVLLDPNTWSEDGTVALAGATASDDARYLAYSISEAGSDWKKMRILDTDSGKDLDETLQWLRWGSATWTKDNQGFYYARYPEPAAGEAYQALALNQMVYYHKLGT